MESADYHCFPFRNTSCSLNFHFNYFNVLLFLYISVICMLTVCGNLLVIVSIAVFKQLHTPTNLIVLSLAVSDFLVGMCVMPVESIRSINSCFYMGKSQCLIFNVIVSIIGSVSLMNIVFVAIDRYFAVCNPLQYMSKMTIRKTLSYIGFGWTMSILYNLVIIGFDYSNQPGTTLICMRECAVPVSNSRGPIDLIVSFLAPCIVMVILYIKILKVALRQAKAISNSTKKGASQINQKSSRKSEMKATKTLGTIVFVYLICWIPWYIMTINIQHFQNSYETFSALLCLFYTNSCINPFIYAVSYPWFKKSAKLVLTLKIFQAASKQFNLFPED
ncbi:trace amine-associated receptor 13c-like [Myxocyprinus asiaticus]|uniref:trace amine-associated receptor 13c-like n=1 Tax=Myxocyprinus asiaticus TaxID=70543 RepID=UPI002222A486|nr:trace amine-associated receptor 13c-like [Myxocyprinus asiaticus]